MLPCYELWLCSLDSEGLGCGFLMSIEAIPSKSKEHCSGTKAGLEEEHARIICLTV